MYTARDASEWREQFWKTLGLYMMPVLNAEGTRINWINYKTGDKHIHFRMEADRMESFISIEITHPQPDIRKQYFEQFIQLKHLLHAELGEEWDWDFSFVNSHGELVSSISRKQVGCSVFKKEDWPCLISFFKTRMIALDAFWMSVQPFFESME